MKKCYTGDPGKAEKLVAGTGADEGWDLGVDAWLLTPVDDTLSYELRTSVHSSFAQRKQ